MKHNQKYNSRILNRIEQRYLFMMQFFLHVTSCNKLESLLIMQQANFYTYLEA